MNSSIVAPLLILPLLFLAASFASSSETAFFSLDRFELKRLKERHKGAHAHIKTLLEHPTRLLIIILMINEFANLAIANSVTRFITHALPEHVATGEHRFMIVSLCSLFIAAPLTLVFGEITPKVLAARLNRFIAAINSRPLILLYKILRPLLTLLDLAISAVLKPLGAARNKSHLSKFMNPLDEQDFIAIMEEAQKEGSLEPLEKKLIQKVFHLDDTSVTQVMVPISKAFVVNEKSKVADVMDEIRREKYSRVPAYAKNRKHITGILYVKDLLQMDFEPTLPEKRVSELTAKPMVIPPSINLAALLRRFRKTKTHLAVVADKQGNAIGIISLEDVLESIFGRIEDERDHESEEPRT